MVFIDVLPNDIMFDIIVRIISNSKEDFVSLKLTSKTIKEALEYDVIYEHAPISRFEIDPWWRLRNVPNLFMERCIYSGNPEAFYVLGLVRFFLAFKILLIFLF